jgi:hypothetical protein
MKITELSHLKIVADRLAEDGTVAGAHVGKTMLKMLQVENVSAEILRIVLDDYLRAAQEMIASMEAL